MSETEEYDSVRVSADGVRVLKRFTADQFPVPAIAFEISSGRTEAVTLRLSDQVPQGVAVDDLGFHPDYGSEYWSIEEDRVTFERELKPDSSYTTVYGIRSADDVEQFLTDPTIESVTPPLPTADSEGDVVLESDDALVKDAISGDIAPGDADEEEPPEEPDGPPTLDLGRPDPAGRDDGGDETGAGDASADRPAGPPADSATSAADPATDESVVARLATELRNGTVSQADVDLLREVLVEQHDGSGSTTARLDQLQQDVAELRAYTGALEEFLDENGTGAELIDSFETQLNEFGTRLDHLETEFVVEVRGRIDDIEEQLDQLESDTAETFDRIDDLEAQTSEIAAHADDADARTTELVRRLDNRDGVDDAEPIDDREEILERLDAIESELSAIQEWREQLISTLGG